MSTHWEPHLDLHDGYIGAYMCKNSLSCPLRICALFMLHRNTIKKHNHYLSVVLVLHLGHRIWEVWQKAVGKAEEWVGKQRESDHIRLPEQKNRLTEPVQTCSESPQSRQNLAFEVAFLSSSPILVPNAHVSELDGCSLPHTDCFFYPNIIFIPTFSFLCLHPVFISLILITTSKC